MVELDVETKTAHKRIFNLCRIANDNNCNRRRGVSHTAGPLSLKLISEWCDAQPVIGTLHRTDPCPGLGRGHDDIARHHQIARLGAIAGIVEHIEQIATGAVMPQRKSVGISENEKVAQGRSH